MCLCVCYCYLCAGACVHECGGQRSTSCIFFNYFHHVFWDTVCHWTLSIQLYWLTNNRSSCLSSGPRIVGTCCCCPSFLFECWSSAMGFFSKKGETELTFLQILILTILMLKAFIYNLRYSLQNSIKSFSFKCALFTKNWTSQRLNSLKVKISGCFQKFIGPWHPAIFLYCVCEAKPAESNAHTGVYLVFIRPLHINIT